MICKAIILSSVEVLDTCVATFVHDISCQIELQTLLSFGPNSIVFYDVRFRLGVGDQAIIRHDRVSLSKESGSMRLSQRGVFGIW